MKYFFTILSFFYFINVYSQQIRPSSSEHIYKEVNGLKNLPKVLYLAAHPDDENTGLLSWLVNQQHINTAYLSLTRGDGGQNLIGSEQGSALGLIRTYELLEARKIDGAKQFFTTAIDFGFSKNPEDTFNQWDIDSITADVVWIIRKFQPDVIITRFPPTAAAGHGQHSASAIIAAEAFKAAADKNRYPEQLKHVKTWQAKRLLWNTFRFGNTNTTSEDQFKITVGQYDPLLGMGYGEMAGLSRSQHQSQGAGTPSLAGVRTEYFTSVLGDPVKKSLFDGVKMNWKDLKRPDIDQTINELIEHYNFNEPSLSIPALVKIKKLISSIDNEQLREEKTATINRIILSSAGLMAEMITSQAESVPGETLNFQLNIISRSKSPVSVQKISVLSDDDKVDTKLPYDSLVSFNYSVKIPHSSEPSEPYWLKHSAKTASQYAVLTDSLIGLPYAPAPLNAKLMLLIEGEIIEIEIPFSYKNLDPIKGDVVEALRIVPAATIKFAQPIYFQQADSSLKLGVNIHSYHSVKNGVLFIKSGNQLISTLKNIDLLGGADTTIQLLIDPQTIRGFANASNTSLEAVLQVGDKSYNKNKQLIRYNHIPVLQYFTPANTQLMNGNLKVKAKRIGYIQGAGDFIPHFLKLAGIDVTVLQDNELSNANRLANFDAIITGIRAINVERRMPRWMQVLNQYVRNGGTLVMQFNTLQSMSTTNIGPYPLTIGRNRVTEESAQVTFLEPKHPILNYPNKITPDDFNGWIQEMGPYFLSEWDKRYTPLFRMNDTGEKPLDGSTIYTAYGKGHFIYTSLSFFRQLPVGNKGAAKLFFNMLSIGKE